MIRFFQAKVMVRQSTRMCKMYAFTKEAFTMRIATILQCHGITDTSRIYEFARGKNKGSMVDYETLREEYTQEWADEVGQAALNLIQSAEEKELGEEDDE